MQILYENFYSQFNSHSYSFSHLNFDCETGTGIPQNTTPQSLYIQVQSGAKKV